MNESNEVDEVGIVLGITTCSNCNKDVPDVLFCLNCGIRLSGDVVIPALKNSEKNILAALAASSEELTVSTIHVNTGKSKGGIRVLLSDMVRLGLVANPDRGKYKITELGKTELKKSKIIKIDTPVKTTYTPILDKPEFLRGSTMTRLFKRAGGTRMGKNMCNALALVLERVGEEIASKAIVIANNNNRKTIKVGDMEQAIAISKLKVLEE